MKRLRSALVAIAMLLCFASGTATALAQPNESYALYLESYLSSNSAEGGVWQSSSAMGEGGSQVSYGLELSDGTSNKFVRFANFNGLPISSATTANFKLNYNGEWSDAVSVSFSYRLSEGSLPYAWDERIATLEIGGVKKHLTLADIELTSQSGMEWKNATVILNLNGIKADRLTVTYYYDGATAWRGNYRYLDIDNVAVTGAGVLCSLDLENAPITTSNKKEVELNYKASGVEAKQSYMLFGSEMVDYSVNTAYSREEKALFNGGDVVVALAKAGNTFYRGATSVKAGESDMFLIYDAQERNSYLRMSNFNDTVGGASTRFTMQFYDNEANQNANMPVTNRIHYSFDYRLYMSDLVTSGFDFSRNILQFSTRSASSNNSGFVSFDELFINEPGDDSWHTFSGVMDVLTTTTANITVYYYYYQNPSFAPDVYLDMDNLSLTAGESTVNYAYLNGTFEGAIPLVSDGNDPLNGNVFVNAQIGSAGEKVRINGSDYAMKLDGGECLSLNLGWKPSTNVFNVTFEVKEEVGELKLWFGGKSGDLLNLTVCANQTASDNSYGIYWEKLNSGYKCHIFFARMAYNPLYSIDLLNSGLSAVTVDDLFIGEVSAVSSVSGNYAEFVVSYEELKSSYEANAASYKSNAKLVIEKALYVASLINEYSSQANINSAIEGLTSAINSSDRLCDLAAVEKALKKAEGIHADGGKDKYTNGTWLLFKQAEAEARAISAESSQKEADAAAKKLEDAIKGLTIAQENGSKVVVALGVGGGAVGVGGVALCAVMIIRRKKNEKN